MWEGDEKGEEGCVEGRREGRGRVHGRETNTNIKNVHYHKRAINSRERNPALHRHANPIPRDAMIKGRIARPHLNPAANITVTTTEPQGAQHRFQE